MRNRIFVWAIVVSLSVMPVTHYAAYKHGRKVMYKQVCERLNITKERSIRIGNSLIMVEGIYTERLKSQPADLCTACHVGGY